MVAIKLQYIITVFFSLLCLSQVCLVLIGSQKGTLYPLELELQKAVSHHVGTENPILYGKKSS